MSEDAVDPMPISASKKSSATPWDAAFEPVSEVVCGLEETSFGGAGPPLVASGEEERMEVDGCGFAEPQHPTAEHVLVVSEPASKAPRNLPVRTEEVASALPRQKTPLTISKKVDVAPIINRLPESAPKRVSMFLSLGGSALLTMGPF